MGDTDSLSGALERSAPEGAAFGSTQAATQSGARAALASNRARRRLLEQGRGNLSPEARRRELSSLDQERAKLQRQIASRSDAQDLPNAVDESKGAQDDLTVIFATLPQSVEVERNSLKDANVAKVTLDFRDVPVDPRIIRACFVSIAMGSVEADEYEDGVVRGATREDGSLTSLVGRNPGQELDFNSTTRFTGFVDEWLVSYGDEGDTVELKCRDVSGVMRDQKMFDPKTGRPVRMDLNKPIAQGTQELLDTFPATRGIKVVFGTPTDPDDPLAVVEPDFGPVPASVMPRTAKPRKGKQPKARKKTEEQSVWDQVLDVTGRLGLVPVLRSFTLYLLEPRVVFADLTRARRMIWGRNVSSLKFARKLGGVRSDTIEVRSPDPTIGRTRWARFPVLAGEPRSGILGKPGSPQPVTSRPNKVSPNGTVQETVRTVSVRSVSDQETLERIAENAFNEIGRQEIEGSLETDDLDSYESEREADLLALEPGEPVQVLVAQPGEVTNPTEAPVADKPDSVTSNLQELQTQSIARRVDFLVELGIARATAERLAVAQEKVALISTFRAHHVTLSWDVEDGLSIGVDFFNFVVVRDAPGDADGRSTAPVSLTEAAGRAGVTR